MTFVRARLLWNSQWLFRNTPWVFQNSRPLLKISQPLFENTQTPHITPQPHIFFGNTFIQRESRSGGESFYPHSNPTSPPLSNLIGSLHLYYHFVNSQQAITFIVSFIGGGTLHGVTWGVQVGFKWGWTTSTPHLQTPIHRTFPKRMWGCGVEIPYRNPEDNDADEGYSYTPFLCLQRLWLSVENQNNRMGNAIFTLFCCSNARFWLLLQAK